MFNVNIYIHFVSNVSELPAACGMETICTCIKLISHTQVRRTRKEERKNRTKRRMNIETL